MMVLADTLPDDPDTLKAMLLAARARAERVEQIIKELQRHRFGRRAETLPEDQLLLGLEEVEQSAASGEAEGEEAAPAERASHAAKRRMNRGSLPAHLPRIEIVGDIEDHNCPCCHNALHRIGEDASERRDIVPTTCHSTGRRRSTPGRASRSIARRWRIGSVALLGCCGRCMSVCSCGSKARPSCSATRPRRRCSIPDAGAPRLVSCGPTPVMIARGADRIRRGWHTSMRPTAGLSGRSLIWPASKASCRWMAMAAIGRSPSAGM